MTIRLLPFLLAFLGTALPVVAQTPAQTPDPPRFLLEQILVEGVQHDAVREIVAAESLLQLGREYSEQELREAVYRVKRLPFVLDAEHSLRPGGDPGSYQLVITVKETRLVFYTADFGGLYDGEDRNFFPGEERIDWGGSATAGGRWFVGSQGFLSASVFGFDSEGPISAQAGYTRYNLFGRGGFASLELVSGLDQGDAYQVSLSMGFPIVGNHSLQADLIWYESKDEFFSQTFRNEARSLGLSWIYDTTDDPFFPTTGAQVTAGGRYSEDEQETRDGLFVERSSSDAYGLELAGRRHWALTRRQSVSTGLLASWDEVAPFAGDDGSFEQWSTRATLGHSLDLWGVEKTERIGDFRWENGLAVHSYQFDSPFGRATTTEARLTTGFAFRNTWGLLRLSFAYVDNLQSDFELRESP